MNQRQLFVVRINYNYDAGLLDKLTQEAIKPFGGVFEYCGVKEKVEKIEFDPPLKPEGLPLWLLSLIQRRLEGIYDSGDMLAVMPHRIMTDSPGWGSGRVAFLSTYSPYLGMENKREFIRYGKKIAAHELGHLSAFDLEHPLDSSIDCLMYVAQYPYDDATAQKAFLDSRSMQFCDKCYNKIKVWEDNAANRRIKAVVERTENNRKPGV